MHLSDTFIQSDLYCIQCRYHCIQCRYHCIQCSYHCIQCSYHCIRCRYLISSCINWESNPWPWCKFKPNLNHLHLCICLTLLSKATCIAFSVDIIAFSVDIIAFSVAIIAFGVDIWSVHALTRNRTHDLGTNLNQTQLFEPFTFMHLSDTSIQSDLHCIECMHRISSCINWESNPYVASSVWAAALEDDGTDIPVNEEPVCS